MHRSPERRPGPAALAFLIALSASACDRSPDLNPPAERARAGLERALNAWKDGQSPLGLAGGDPPVQVVDSDWNGGKKLASFEVVREVPSAADKRFAVRLTFAAPRAEVEAEYIVLGAGPLSIFRAEDYDRSMNMDNTATPRKKR